MLKQGPMTLFRVLAICVVVASCSSTGAPSEYQNELIELQRQPTGYLIDGVFVSDDTLEALPEVLTRFQSKKVIIGSGDEITMMQLLEIGPVLSGSGYEMYIVGEDGELKEMNFIGGG